MVARWVELNSAAVDAVTSFYDEYTASIDSRSTIQDAYDEAFKLAKSIAEAKIHRINLTNPVNVVANLECGVGKKITAMIP